MNPLSVSDTFEGIVEDVGFGGEGVIRVNGQVVFVPGVLPGERIRGQITSCHQRYARGICLSIEGKVSHRIVPSCPLAIRPEIHHTPNPYCCGCQYQHTIYTYELELKKKQLLDLLARVGKISTIPPIQVIPSPSPLGYRNKIVLHLNHSKSTQVGYISADNKTFLPIDYCGLAVQPINEWIQSENQKRSLWDDFQDCHRLILRYTSHNGVFPWSPEQKKSITLLTESTCLGPIQVPHSSFFQVNIFAFELLYPPICELIKQANPSLVIDLYCGVGIFAWCALQLGVPQTVGIEIDPDAVQAAKVHVDRLGYGKQARFFTGAAEKVLPRFTSLIRSNQTMIIVDPPRTGLHFQVLKLFLHVKPSFIVYISCGPDTLARDLKVLSSGGYEITSIYLVDLFPRTTHFEVISFLQYTPH